MAQRLTLSVLTPERRLLQITSVRKVRVKLEDGVWLSVYPHHAPLMASILPGPLQYEVDLVPERPDSSAKVEEITISGGILSIAGDEVVILTQGALKPDALKESGGVGSAAQEFDRLARQLMLSLGAKAGGVLPHLDES